MKIAISIGHGRNASGGYDSGAVGGGYHEFKLAKEIGKYAGEALAVYDCDVDIMNYNGEAYLTDRINYINKNGYDLALEIHLNANGGTGSEVYYKHGNTAGKKLAAAISKSIANNLSIKDRGAKIKLSGNVDYFGFVRSVKCQSLLVETVFIDTASDRNKVVTAAGQKKCGQAIASAIANYYGLKKLAVVPSKAAKFGAGDTVKITGKCYATGQTIPAWVKLRNHTVKSVNASGKVLLKEINSYVWADDLQLVKSAKKGIVVGSTVTIKSGSVYGGLSTARGKAIPKEQLAPKKHKVTKIQTNNGVREALLGDILSWVAVSSLTEV